jgi:hypothetical protein
MALCKKHCQTNKQTQEHMETLSYEGLVALLDTKEQRQFGFFLQFKEQIEALPSTWMSVSSRPKTEKFLAAVEADSTYFKVVQALDSLVSKNNGKGVLIDDHEQASLLKSACVDLETFQKYIALFYTCLKVGIRYWNGKSTKYYVRPRHKGLTGPYRFDSWSSDRYKPARMLADCFALSYRYQHYLDGHYGLHNPKEIDGGQYWMQNWSDIQRIVDLYMLGADQITEIETNLRKRLMDLVSADEALFSYSQFLDNISHERFAKILGLKNLHTEFHVAKSDLETMGSENFLITQSHAGDEVLITLKDNYRGSGGDYSYTKNYYKSMKVFFAGQVASTVFANYRTYGDYRGGGTNWDHTTNFKKISSGDVFLGNVTVTLVTEKGHFHKEDVQETSFRPLNQRAITRAMASERLRGFYVERQPTVVGLELTWWDALKYRSSQVSEQMTYPTRREFVPHPTDPFKMYVGVAEVNYMERVSNVMPGHMPAIYCPGVFAGIWELDVREEGMRVITTKQMNHWTNSPEVLPLTLEMVGGKLAADFRWFSFKLNEFRQPVLTMGFFKPGYRVDYQIGLQQFTRKEIEEPALLPIAVEYLS